MMKKYWFFFVFKKCNLDSEARLYKFIPITLSSCITFFSYVITCNQCLIGRLVPIMFKMNKMYFFKSEPKIKCFEFSTATRNKSYSNFSIVQFQTT